MIFKIFFLISVQVPGVCPEIHSYAHRAQALKAEFANIRPSVYVQQCPVARFSLTLFYGASKKKKKHSLLFPQSVGAACILNNIPICAVLPCSHTVRESEQMQSAVSPSCSVQLFVCPRISIIPTLITFLR